MSALSVEQSLQPRVRAARIVGARVVPRRVRPGARATLLLVQAFAAITAITQSPSVTRTETTVMGHEIRMVLPPHNE